MRLAVNHMPKGQACWPNGKGIRVIITAVMSGEGEPDSRSYLLTKEDANQLALDLYSALMTIDEWDRKEPPEYQLTEADLSHDETPPNPFEDDLTVEVLP
jgi:hypothetical protein